VTFTCDLTIDELVLVEEVGFEPLDLVMGSTYFHIGWQPTLGAGWTQNFELVDITAMMVNARLTAMARLFEQLAACKADGVVGVRLEIEREGNHAEFTAIGTAVRRKDGDHARWRKPNGQPFSCDLSGADFWALVRGGFRPVGLAYGACVYHIAHQSLGQWFSTVNQNTEMPAFTQGLYDARELAMQRMQYEAFQMGGTGGLVGVNVTEGSHGWGSHVIEFAAVGTCVLPIGDPAHETHEAPGVVLGAQDR
jgi:uncharacterized protein YbjQ (UPF0145 family)